jgi:hypothetical protein
VTKKAEYKEGKEARENFEKLAAELFQVPKSAVSAPAKQKRQPKKTTSQKKSGKDKA